MIGSRGEQTEGVRLVLRLGLDVCEILVCLLPTMFPSSRRSMGDLDAADGMVSE